MNDRKKALVTGGATGIGRSAVLALARAGYDIALIYGSSAAAAAEVAARPWGRRRCCCSATSAMTPPCAR
jgi:NAD(P)-dependent dehydrogenase (short-subunit alcohol dehydrogenase family)